MAGQDRRKGGKGAGSKSVKNPGAASRKAKRIRSHARLEKKKARNVIESSKGLYTLVQMRKMNEHEVARFAR